MDTYLPHSELASEAQLEAIRSAALHRAGFMRWIAAKLLVTDDKLIRREASAILMQLSEGA